jgi:Ca2+-binding EF-hand superfamily protein
MGSEESKIAEETRLPRHEIAWLHERYEVLTQRSATSRESTELLTRAQFMSKFPDSQHQLAKLLFDAMDTGAKGEVDFRHFCAAVTVLSHGARRDKINFAFRLYDKGDKGYIDKADLHDIVLIFRSSCRKISEQLRAMEHANGGEKDAADDDGSPGLPLDSADQDAELVRERTDVLADSLWGSMDRSGTGKVSKDDFMVFCDNHPDVIAQVEQTYVALRRAAMFDWSQPNHKGTDDCIVA